MLQAVKLNVDSLKCASTEFKTDPAFMKEACLQHAKALRYTPASLKADRDFMLDVVKHWGGAAMQSASAEIKADRSFLLETLKIWPSVLHFAPEELLCDQEFMLEALTKNIESLRYAPDELKSSSEFMVW